MFSIVTFSDVLVVHSDRFRPIEFFIIVFLLLLALPQVYTLFEGCQVVDQTTLKLWRKHATFATLAVIRVQVL